MRRFTTYEAEPAQIMRAAVKERGKQIFTGAAKQELSELIHDSYANNPEIRDMLQKAAESGIPEELLNLYGDSDRDQKIRAIARRFSEKTGLLPEDVNKAVSCFTFALDYGMFYYSAYAPPRLRKNAPAPVYPARIIPAAAAEKQVYAELKDMDEGGGSETFADFKTWFDKKRLEEEALGERNTGNIYIKGRDGNYYELAQTDYLTEPGTNFHALYDNFSPEKKEREIIKMGIDICAELEALENDIILKPSDIFRDKYGNYRLGGNAGKGIVNANGRLGSFMRELLGGKTNSEALGAAVARACEDDGYGAAQMKKDLEYAFELALEEKLLAGPSVLTRIKAGADEYTNENIEDVIIPDKYAAIGARAFVRRAGLRSAIIPNTVGSVCGFAFGWCGGLENVTVEDGADINIGSFAFWGCENLRKITMRGAVVNNIGDCVFYGSRKLKVEIYGDINGGAESLLDRAFFGSRDLEVNIYTGGKRKEKKYDRIFNNRVQFI